MLCNLMELAQCRRFEGMGGGYVFLTCYGHLKTDSLRKCGISTFLLNVVYVYAQIKLCICINLISSSLVLSLHQFKVFNGNSLFLENFTFSDQTITMVPESYRLSYSCKYIYIYIYIYINESNLALIYSML